MLADRVSGSIQSGRLSREIQRPAAFLRGILDFVRDQIALWRDSPDRDHVTAETRLTSQLCGFLTSAARFNQGWDILQFRVEETDEAEAGRKVDLVASPCDAVLWVEGQRFTHFNTLVPIECKRLPIPHRADRDTREYVFSRHSSTGGIQRFKLEHHGAQHALGGMIGYIQNGTGRAWVDQINDWIGDLVLSGEPGWGQDDRLTVESENTAARVYALNSRHRRKDTSSGIDLRHIWIEMQ